MVLGVLMFYSFANVLFSHSFRQFNSIVSITNSFVSPLFKYVFRPFIKPINIGNESEYAKLCKMHVGNSSRCKMNMYKRAKAYGPCKHELIFEAKRRPFARTGKLK